MRCRSSPCRQLRTLVSPIIMYNPTDCAHAMFASEFCEINSLVYCNSQPQQHLCFPNSTFLPSDCLFGVKHSCLSRAIWRRRLNKSESVAPSPSVHVHVRDIAPNVRLNSWLATPHRSACVQVSVCLNLFRQVRCTSIQRYLNWMRVCESASYNGVRSTFIHRRSTHTHWVSVCVREAASAQALLWLTPAVAAVPSSAR